MSLVFKNFFPEYLEIAPEISMNLTSSKKFSQIPKIEDNKIICFNVNGDINGSFYCTIDKEISDYEFSIFTESMNIMLGNTLASLEENSGFVVNIDCPLFEQKNISNISARNLMHCTLTIQLKNFDCFIYHDLQQFFDQKLITKPVNYKEEGSSHA